MAPSSWLSKQRKSSLIDLAVQAGLDLDSDLNKPDIVEALDEHLHSNATRLSRDPAFEPFFLTRRTPHKSAATRDISDDGEVKSVVRGRGRRATKVKSEPEDDDDYTSTTRAAGLSSPTAPMTRARTPAASIMQRRRSSLPPSPTVVVDEVEHALTKSYANLSDLYTLSGIPEAISTLRETCSSLAAVHLLFSLLEAGSLFRALIPLKYAFDTPSPPLLRTPSHALRLPDLFVLLTPAFWLPTLLWTTTNVLLPLLAAYFFNLTVHTVKRANARVRVVRYTYDPFTFNVAKMLLVSTVYGAGLLQGWVADEVVGVVEDAQYGGYHGMLMGSYVCGAYAVWEAAQR